MTEMTEAGISLSHVTPGMILETLARVVASKPEGFTYKMRPDPDLNLDDYLTCLYVWDGKPDCIAGHVLVELGVPVHVLSPWEGNACDCVSASMGMPMTSADVLRSAQIAQDQGHSWGEALVAAVQYLVSSQRAD